MCVLECDNCAMKGKKIAYQLHVTFHEKPDNLIDYGYNIIELSNICRGGGSYKEWISSDAFDELEHLGAFFSRNYPLFKIYNSVRVKIETVPWNTDFVPTKECRIPKERLHDELQKNYFETHFTIKAPMPENMLDGICASFDCHISLNNKHQDKLYITNRQYNTVLEEHLNHVNTIKSRLLDNGLECVKVVTEYILGDTNPGLDDKWMKSKLL